MISISFSVNFNFKLLLERNLEFKFNSQPLIVILDCWLNFNLINLIFINSINFLNDKKIKHAVADLQKNIWDYSTNMETHTVETHIYRLRKKISDLFKDEKFILSHKNGYFID